MAPAPAKTRAFIGSSLRGMGWFAGCATASTGRACPCFGAGVIGRVHVTRKIVDQNRLPTRTVPTTLPIASALPYPHCIKVDHRLIAARAQDRNDCFERVRLV